MIRPASSHASFSRCRRLIGLSAAFAASSARRSASFRTSASPEATEATTPRKESTHSLSTHLSGSSETYSLAKPYLRSEIAGTLRYDVPWEKFHDKLLMPSDPNRCVVLQQRIDTVLATVSKLRTADGWNSCNDYPEEKFLPDFCALWNRLIDLSKAPPGPETDTSAADDGTLSLPRREYRENRTCYLTGTNAKRKLDFYVCASGGQLRWQDVLFFAEMKNHKKKYPLDRINLQIAGYAREVFYCQPHRFFVNALYLNQSVVSLYRLDRCGALVCTRFDMHSEYEKFVTAVLAYAYMDDADIGFDPAFTVRSPATDTTAAMAAPDTTTTNETTPATTTTDSGIPRMDSATAPPATNFSLRVAGVEYNLEKRLAQQKTLVGRATSCWVGRPVEEGTDSYVIKSSWRQRSQSPEERIYELAKAKGVSGLLDFCPERSEPAVTTVLAGVRRGCHGNASQANYPRKRKDTGTDAAFEARTSKRSRTNSAAVEDDSRDDNQDGDRTTDADKDRVCARLVFRNAVCVPLKDVPNAFDAFAAILAAVRTHRTLYIKAKEEDEQILHCDISVNNILATTPETRLTGHDAGQAPPAGVLFDFDHTITLRERITDATHRTGTDAFVAASVLAGSCNTYRADLESFFYVMCWLCCRTEKEDQKEKSKEKTPSKPPLQQWLDGDLETKSAMKQAMVDDEWKFAQLVIAKVTPRYKGATGLLERVRRAVAASKWFTRRELNAMLARKRAEAEAAQPGWVERAGPEANQLEAPLAQFEQWLVAEEDRDAHDLYEEMVAAIEDFLQTR